MMNMRNFFLFIFKLNEAETFDDFKNIFRKLKNRIGELYKKV